MRDVTVMNVARLHIPVFEPFLELAFLADLIRSQPGPCRFDLVSEILVDAQDSGSVNAVREQIANDLVVHRRTGADGDAVLVAVLR